ncbi:MAG: 6-phosphogluconate dehydrogenase [Gammaproteobacteria bacterium TMED78]|nr:MAG: 6-phosphogluconate dehydrogenase [Gammaproteobacteria bacterium TMED78]|tara:strand:- start:36691 stop:37617 length:927 start_codon:yes stop_codon:yes gene_type:complete
MSELKDYKIGWIGAGRMGFPMAKRLIEAGCDVAIYNRTKSKAEPLREIGATLVDVPAELSDRDVVFTMVSTSDDLLSVTFGDHGLLTNDTTPKMLVDCSSVSEEASANIRKKAKDLGVEMLAAPVSGNGKVVKAGKLTIVASGPKESFDMAEPYLDRLGRGVTYVGEGELARMVKICHNLLLGVYSQCLAEITVLAEKGGVPRHATLDFINNSVMGSMFSQYKTPAFVTLDMTPTFTPALLRKDLDLGLKAGESLGVDLPVTATTREMVQRTIDAGHDNTDFLVLLEEQAKASGLELSPEDTEVSDGL